MKKTAATTLFLLLAATTLSFAGPTTPLQVSVCWPFQLVPSGWDVFGLRVSGIYALNEDVAGLDVGGINHVTGAGRGFQIGAVNLALSNHPSAFPFDKHSGPFPSDSASYSGFQIGAYNFAENVYGFQIGAINQAENVRGIEIGAFNYAEDVCGLQIGVFNYATELRGLQIGLINRVQKSRLPFMPIIYARY